MSNNIFGAVTAERFTSNFSAYYQYWNISQFIYYVFVRSWVLLAISIGSFTPFIGFIFGWAYLPFDIFSDYIPLFTTLYLTNAAYDSFHPTVAPELSFTAPAVGEACFDWNTFAVFNTQASGGQCTSGNYQASLDHKYYQQIFGENVGA